MSFTNYKTFPVVHLFPYWKGTPTDQILRPVETSGSPIAYSYSRSNADYPQNLSNHKYLCNGKDKIGEINDLFDANLGRYDNLWFPSWREDIDLLANISAVATTINIADIEYATFYPSLPGTGRYIFIYVNQNTWYAREVISFPGATWIEIDLALGAPVTVNNCKMICFLYLGRFDIDEIEWEYVTPDIAITELYFAELPQEYALL